MSEKFERLRQRIAEAIDPEAFSEHALTYEPGPYDFPSNWGNRRTRASLTAGEVIRQVAREFVLTQSVEYRRHNALANEEDLQLAIRDFGCELADFYDPEDLRAAEESRRATPEPAHRSDEVPPHVFEAFDGATGRACTKMVVRGASATSPGWGEDCGLPSGHPVHAPGVRYIDDPTPSTHFIYTDGACDREGYGAWAWVSENGSQCGNEYPTTNNRMELQAAIMALSSGFLPDDVTIVTDSAYVSNCFLERWYDGWRQNGWVNSKKKPVDNRDLWEELLALVESWQGELNWLHVRGHGRGENDDPVHVEGNRKADELAVTERIFGRKHRERQ